MIIHHLPDGDVAHHYKKSIVILFAGKRKVLSTGPDNGGYREDLQAVFNYDANPGAGMACVMRADTYEEHMNVIAEKDLALRPEKCTGLCTAASMENASVKTQSYKNLTVTAIVTAGIEHNGGRAGDPADYYEENGQYYFLPKGEGKENEPGNSVQESAAKNAREAVTPGTINILLHMNVDMDAGTLARTIMTATEAKAAALQELRARSHHSAGIATGSGTDGIISICNPESKWKMTNGGKNSKLGELIARTVKEAVKEALYKQTGLCPERQRDILRQMERYGVNEDTLWDMYRLGSREEEKELSKADFIDWLDHIKKTEKLVTGTILYAHLLDQVEWGILSQEQAIRAGEKILSEMELEKGGERKEKKETKKQPEKKEQDKKQAEEVMVRAYMKKVIGLLQE